MPRARRLAEDAGAIDRDVLLEAALQAFAAHGYDRMSVRALNRDLGVSHNYAHFQFSSKKALWQAAVDHGLGQLATAWDASRWNPDEDPRTRFRQELRRMLEMMSRHPAISKIIEREGAVGGERLDYIVDRFVAPAIRSALPFFEGITRFKTDRLQVASAILLIANGAISFVTQPALARKLGVADPTSSEAIAAHIDTVIEIYLHGVLGSRGP